MKKKWKARSDNLFSIGYFANVISLSRFSREISLRDICICTLLKHFSFDCRRGKIAEKEVD